VPLNSKLSDILNKYRKDKEKYNGSVVRGNFEKRISEFSLE